MLRRRWLALSQSSPLHDELVNAGSICFIIIAISFCRLQSSRDFQLRVWVLVALGTFVDAILFSSLNDGVLSFVVKMKPKRVSTDMVIRRANYSRDQGVGQEPRF